MVLGLTDKSPTSPHSLPPDFNMMLEIWIAGGLGTDTVSPAMIFSRALRAADVLSLRSGN